MQHKILIKIWVNRFQHKYEIFLVYIVPLLEKVI